MNKCEKIKNNFNKEKNSYIVGFLLSLCLTIIPFFCTLNHLFSREINFFIILLCALSQIIIHFVFFLHLSFSKKNSWNIISLLFVLIIVFIVVFGSIWIMYNLNHHLMF
ncbi:cytochrome o ubiquinol oxidase subunit IV [Buchnera aphidicola]|uniref:Cytochrome bo(3) ubiquinol oxidase subunit 4 n=1 Tax=Buchnera aphidicola subsp. Rhopalosiphum maidis TaxID=118109 RepID=A0A3G2I5H3_BUCRM|nr:cytochrome o ubiquinol oxidase subunit IV [Buchnera aphidicola]AYN24617.1 cytochrome o ubiquinol oxidase subunit IV [Buchnera aphidicola (Rhopalosiphum maidis)]